ncbi:MAG: hypothetical protein ACREYE_23295 [Gammaproteobacteria bacterium]
MYSTDGLGGGRIFIRGGRLVADSEFITANTLSDQDGQGIDIDITGELTVRNGAEISAITFGAGRGGDVWVEAADLLLSGDGSEFGTGIAAQTVPGSTGAAGNVTVKADKLAVRNGSDISASTFGTRRGGDVWVEAADLLLSQDGAEFVTGIAAQAAPGSTGAAGNVTVKAGKLTVRNGSDISASTIGTGQGGDVWVEAADILLSGDGSRFFTGITSQANPGSTGAAGDVAVRANRLAIRDGAKIAASTLGTGRGGSIAITAQDIELSNRGGIFARSLGSSDSAISGNIFIQAQDSLRIFDQSRISVETRQANAGDINLNVGNLLHLRDNSAITTSVAGGQGDGGSITIDPTFVVLDGSRIVANARQGRGGNIRIVSDFFFASPDSIVSASSDLGIDGIVDIESPDTDVISGALELPESFLDAASLLSDRCSARTAKGSSSFVVSGRGGVPPGPETMLPVYAFDLSAKADGSADRPLGEADYGSLIV